MLLIIIIFGVLFYLVQHLSVISVVRPLPDSAPYSLPQNLLLLPANKNMKLYLNNFCKVKKNVRNVLIAKKKNKGHFMVTSCKS